MIKTHRVDLTSTELDHLLTALRDESRSGHYYGDRHQFSRRRERIWRKLEAAYTALTGREGYPLKPSMLPGGTPKGESK